MNSILTLLKEQLLFTEDDTNFKNLQVDPNKSLSVTTLHRLFSKTLIPHPYGLTFLCETLLKIHLSTSVTWSMNSFIMSLKKDFTIKWMHST